MAGLLGRPRIDLIDRSGAVSLHPDMDGTDPTGDDLDPFPCPRCGLVVTERFWGPCTACRAQLVEIRTGEGRTSPAEGRFEPAMHVVPNHVATKD